GARPLHRLCLRGRKVLSHHACRRLHSAHHRRLPRRPKLVRRGPPTRRLFLRSALLCRRRRRIFRSRFPAKCHHQPRLLSLPPPFGSLSDQPLGIARYRQRPAPCGPGHLACNLIKTIFIFLFFFLSLFVSSLCPCIHSNIILTQKPLPPRPRNIYDP